MRRAFEPRSKSKSKSQSKSKSHSRERSRDDKQQDFSQFDNISMERKKFRQELSKKFKRQSSKSSRSSSPQQVQKIKPSQEQKMFAAKVPTPNSEQSFDMFEGLQQHLHNHPTDHESYYRIVKGEILNNHYKIIDTCGKGVFGNVVRVVNIQNQKEFAIKILRNNEMIMKSGQKQAGYLKKINSQYVIKCYQTFMHRSHFCIVFQLLGADVRSKISERLFTLEEVKKYSIHLFIGMHALRKQKLVHADIKPDNLLFTTNFQSIKICDFGTAFPQDQANIVEYLVARYYRAPEIILGCNIDYAIDVWSIGCTLYEMVTGEFLFPGKDNNEVLKYIMRTRGKFSLKSLRKGAFAQKHFDKNYNFIDRQIDPVTLQVVHKSVTIVQDRELLKLLKAKNCEDTKKLVIFKDFLERCLALNPKSRLTPDEALKHPFLNYQFVLN